MDLYIYIYICIYIYTYNHEMKTTHRPGYHQNGAVATHALEHNITQELKKERKPLTIIKTFCVVIN